LNSALVCDGAMLGEYGALREEIPTNLEWAE
jgi:hypothetical protein